jgi:hypothetical protein
MLCCLRKHRVVKRGHQRRTLAAGRDVPAAKIANYVDAGKFGDQRAVDELQRVPVGRLVAHGLPVTADGCNGARINRSLGEQCLHDGSIPAREFICRER